MKPATPRHASNIAKPDGSEGAVPLRLAAELSGFSPAVGSDGARKAATLSSAWLSSKGLARPTLRESTLSVSSGELDADAIPNIPIADDAVIVRDAASLLIASIRGESLNGSLLTEVVAVTG